ncbi:MAG: glycyl-radical enzyme activating protein [Clostridia bacterium]
MKKGMVFQIQKFCTDDGPGIRTTVFLKGCPLNCLWCHNPEGLSTKKIIAINYNKCVVCGKCMELCDCHKISENKHIYNSENCTTCGKCIDICKTSAISFCGKEMDSESVMKSVLADRAFYKNSGGGLTLSGGEPLLQDDFALELLQKAKEENIHTCVETSLGVGLEKIEKVAPFVDLFLCDIKETDEENHKKYIGISNKLILENLKKLCEMGKKIKLRCPIIPSVNDRENHFEILGKIYKSHENIIDIQFMPYHILGQGKSDRYGLNLSEKAFEVPSDETKTLWNEKLKAIKE